jgi:hypothetical protein
MKRIFANTLFALALILFMTGCNSLPGTTTNSTSPSNSGSSDSSGSSGNSASPVLNVSNFQIVYNTEANTASGSFDASIANISTANYQPSVTFSWFNNGPEDYPIGSGQDNGGTMTVYFNNVYMGSDTYAEACQEGLTVWATFDASVNGGLPQYFQAGQHVSINCSGGDEQRPVGVQKEPRL